MRKLNIYEERLSRYQKEFESFIDYLYKKITRDFHKRKYEITAEPNTLRFKVRNSRYLKQFRKSIEFITATSKGLIPGFKHYVKGSEYFLVGVVPEPYSVFYYISVKDNNTIKAVRVNDTHSLYIDVDVELKQE